MRGVARVRGKSRAAQAIDGANSQSFREQGSHTKYMDVELWISRPLDLCSILPARLQLLPAPAVVWGKASPAGLPKRAPASSCITIRASWRAKGDSSDSRARRQCHCRAG